MPEQHQATKRPLVDPYFPPTVHLYDYLAILRKRKWVLILIFLFTVSTVAVYSFHATPVYKATAQIMKTVIARDRVGRANVPA